MSLLLMIPVLVGVFSFLIARALDHESARAIGAILTILALISLFSFLVGRALDQETAAAIKVHNSVPFRSASPGVLKEGEPVASFLLVSPAASRVYLDKPASPSLSTSAGGIGTAATYRDGLTKEFGDGLIRVNRLGPEAWRWALVKERRRSDMLQRRLTTRVLQVRALRRQVRSTLTVPTGHWLDGAFLCIHRYERGAAGWRTLTGNGFSGGLQMDSSFQRTYGPVWARRAFGESAHLWPASVQITAAIQAWTTRGFGPWPSTRRMCGL